jgi:hypothetical protein
MRDGIPLKKVMDNMSDRCDQDVYNNGVEVFLTHTIAAKDIEKWVQAVAKLSGQKVDWHYAGGRAIILTLGDTYKVKEAIKNLRSMHDEAYRKASSEFKFGSSSETERIIEGIWRYSNLE